MEELFVIKSPRHQETLVRALTELKKIRFIEEVWLFGNCTIQPTYESDVDLWVKVNDKVTAKEMRQVKSSLYFTPEVDMKFYRTHFKDKSDFHSDILRKEAVRVL